MDLEKEYDMVNREALWQVLKMYDVVGKQTVESCMQMTWFCVGSQRKT